jgi:membrane-bound lytic murein transglycosylase
MEKNSSCFENYIRGDNDDFLEICSNFLKLSVTQQPQDKTNTNLETEIKNRYPSNTRNDGYTFDGMHFENIEKLAASSQIQNIKIAFNQSNKEDFNKQYDTISRDSPELYSFMEKNSSCFENYIRGDNDASLNISVTQQQP